MADRSKARQRKEAKRKAKRQEQRRAGTLSSGDLAKSPVYQCLINDGWQSGSELTQVLLARRGSSGAIATATLLVDLQCLGLKNGFRSHFATVAEYQNFVGAMAMRFPRGFVPCAPALAARIVSEAERYAGSLGFLPHPDAKRAAAFFAGITASDDDVPTGGPDGKPLFIQGPDDDVEFVVGTLRRVVGDGNFQVQIFN